MPVKVTWYESVERLFTTTVPIGAFAQAAVEAAGVAASGIHSTYSGTLARHVSVPGFITPLMAEIGSGPAGRAPLVYGAIEHFGGTIHGRPLLYIRDRRGSGTSRPTRSNYGGPIVAVVPSVYHRGKGYLDPVGEMFASRFMSLLEAGMPG